ncbi:MAG: hypothetical protein K0R80_2410 [Clostridia bacterium]|nr:hypothetical protein [Clostridia bacterium]
MKENQQVKECDGSLFSTVQKEIIDRKKIDMTLESISEFIDEKKDVYIKALEYEHEEQMKAISENNTELDEASKLGDSERIRRAFQKVLDNATKNS